MIMDVHEMQAAASVSSVVGQPFISGTSSGSYGPRMQLGAPSRRRSVARLGPPLPRRRTSDENADAHSVSEFEWDGGSTADVMLASRATSSRSRRSSVSAPEHAFPQVCILTSPLPACCMLKYKTKRNLNKKSTNFSVL